ncbi:MAG: rod shape-determining protein MreD [Lactobacillus iners]|nr:rod shape-determining protein MreD [Lactobacillus iners]MCT7824721.1 rod shape-determining protein MreD [Lactobacillus iners]
MVQLKRWYIAIALFFTMVLDGVLSQTFTRFLGNMNVACWLSIILITLIALSDTHNMANVWLCLVVGLVYDIYYVGVIGIYIVAFPLLCYCVQKIAKYIPELFITRLLVCLLGYIGVYLYLLLVLNIIGIIDISLFAIIRQLVESLVMCGILYILSYNLLLKLIVKYPFLNKQIFY